MRQAVIFGAGSVGRGFIGQLLCEAGWRVTFLDVAPELVKALAADGSYPHVTLSNAGSSRTLVGPVTAIDARDVKAAVQALAEADLAATSVGARVLPAVADTLAKAVALRIELGRPPLNVLLAENLHDCAAVMRSLLAVRLPELSADVLDAEVGLLETSIGRMIPVPNPEVLARQPSIIFAEPYKLLPYDASAARGQLPDVPGLVADSSVPFSFYLDRKLYVHNMGHCFTAYLGMLVGATTIWEAIADPGIRYLARAAMVETGIALSERYSTSAVDLLGYVDDLLRRFGNRALADTTERVGRDPGRKMAGGDRLLGAFEFAASQRLPAHHLSLAVAAGAVRLQRTEGWDATRLWRHLAANLADGVLDDSRRELIEAQVAALALGFDFAEQIDLIERAGQTQPVL